MKLKMQFKKDKIVDPIDLNLIKASILLKRGKIIAFPTDTIYGLAVDATSNKAVKKLFKLKGRSPNKPLPIHVKNIDEAEKYGYFSKNAERLAEVFWPGKLTIVMKKLKNAKISPYATAHFDTIGLRIPKHPIANKLLDLLDFPVTSTSANKSGAPASLWPEMVGAQLGKHLKIIINGGQCKDDVPSTIIDLSNDKHPILIREGAIKKEEIEDIIGKISI
jgi:L-threonylcarbamoyladenylate synthase